MRAAAQIEAHYPNVAREDLSIFWSGKPGEEFRGWTSGGLGLRGPVGGHRERVLLVKRVTMAESARGKEERRTAVLQHASVSSAALREQIAAVQEQGSDAAGFVKCDQCAKNCARLTIDFHMEHECKARPHAVHSARQMRVPRLSLVFLVSLWDKGTLMSTTKESISVISRVRSNPHCFL